MQANSSPIAYNETATDDWRNRLSNTANTALLTRHEVAGRLATCLRTVDEAIAKGDIEIIKIGRSVRIRQSALELFIEARATRCNPLRARKMAVKKIAKRASGGEEESL